MPAALVLGAFLIAAGVTASVIWAELTAPRSPQSSDAAGEPAVPAKRAA